MDKQEKIVCAAVRDSDSSFDFEYVTLCLDYPVGVKEQSKGGKKKEFGFITSKNRFVDAKEAMEIAIEQDQILEINNCFAEFHEAQLAENFRKVNTLLGELQSLKLKHASRELKPEDLY